SCSKRLIKVLLGGVPQRARSHGGGDPRCAPLDENILEGDAKTIAEMEYWWALLRMRPDGVMRLVGYFNCLSTSSSSSGVVTVLLNKERARAVFAMFKLGVKYEKDCVKSVSDGRRQRKFLSLPVSPATTPEEIYSDSLMGDSARQAGFPRNVQAQVERRRVYLLEYRRNNGPAIAAAKQVYLNTGDNRQKAAAHNKI
ncbi:hypothetical protein B484DRAFT_439672, partial [Ochromonadaceae sp. CCMP2298]